MRALTSVVMCLALGASLTYADGILRVPQRDQDDIILPLVCVQATVEIHEQVAITTVRNSFINTRDTVIDPIFHYRLPSGASVTGFGMWRDTVFYKFELRPGEQGGPGHGAGDNPDLNEFLGDNSLSMPLDSIPPGLVMVQVQFAEFLPYDFGVVSMTYPLWGDGFLAGAIDTISISVSLDAQREVTSLAAATFAEYTVIDQPDAHNATVTLAAEAMIPLEDWRLEISFNQEDIGAWLYAQRADTARAGYFILVVDPGIVDTSEQVQKYFTFVLDRSGSMGGTKIVQAKQAVIECLDQLIDSDYFNIIQFGTDVQRFSGEMMQASEENLDEARNYVDNIQANGSTNLYGAVSLAIEQEMGEGSANQVVLATDGHPNAGRVTDPDAIVDSVTAHNVYNARIFSFGFGSAADVNAAFLESLSAENNGIAFIFDPNEQAIDDFVAGFYRYVARPVLVNPEVEFEEGLATDSLYPPNLQDVAEGKQLYLFGRYGSFGEYDITLAGDIQGGDTTFVYESLPFPEQLADNPFVPRMWAKAVIDYWLKWLLIQGERGNEDIIDKIIELSLEYGILTPYTEYEPPEPPPDAVEEPFIIAFGGVFTTGGMELSWAVSGVAATVSFNVYRAFSPGGEFERINDRALSTPYFLDRDVKRGNIAYYRIEMLADGKSFFSPVFTCGLLPESVLLNEPSPNPFNGWTTVSYLLPENTAVRLALYDMQGRELRRLYQGEQAAGAHFMSVDGLGLPSGNYFVRLQAGAETSTRTLHLLK